jgi:hypothetical protein
MEMAGAEYVIAGGLATQLHVSDPRFTADVDVVARQEDGARIADALDQLSTEFKLLGQRRHWIQASHRPTGTPIDINTSPLFAQLLLEPDHVELAGRRLPIATAAAIAYTKLRTQQARWPRQPRKRLIDRADLMQLLQDNAGLYERLRALAERRLHELLDEIYTESQIVVEPYPEFDEPDESHDRP